jgi:hypothetical protein
MGINLFGQEREAGFNAIANVVHAASFYLFIGQMSRQAAARPVPALPRNDILRLNRMLRQVF